MNKFAIPFVYGTVVRTYIYVSVTSQSSEVGFVVWNNRNLWADELLASLRRRRAAQRLKQTCRSCELWPLPLARDASMSFISSWDSVSKTALYENPDEETGLNFEVLNRFSAFIQTLHIHSMHLILRYWAAIRKSSPGRKVRDVMHSIFILQINLIGYNICVQSCTCRYMYMNIQYIYTYMYM